MPSKDSTPRTLEEQERLLLQRGFSKAPEGKTPLPGQYTIQPERKNGTEPVRFIFWVNSGHSIQKLTVFSDEP
ncbi:hypothetical protein [Halodesulfovibrio sp.]|jgi:hypothetical protein|uniref:hypothetical protein n=1 Tax=Halodesulfovibrio sp. TaxID=1912772 RepID=UPI002600F9C7|nr:hypothetical protein [Halodesulfovibrio sp.]MCT4534320.1 hypothetical protein [Halodesulfovibrio sp.]